MLRAALLPLLAAAAIHSRTSRLDGCDEEAVHLLQHAASHYQERLANHSDERRLQHGSEESWLQRLFRTHHFRTTAKLISRRSSKFAKGGTSPDILKVFCVIVTVLVMFVGLPICFLLLVMTLSGTWPFWSKRSDDANRIADTGKIPMTMTATLLVTAMCAQCITEQYLPSIPEIAHDLEVSEEAMSLSINVGAIGNVMFGFPLGILAERWGRKPIIIGINIILCVSAVTSGSATSLPWFMASRVMQGVAEGGFASVLAAIGRDCFQDAGKRAEFLCAVLIVFTAGPIMGPVVGGLVSSWIGWRYGFLILGCLSFINVFAAYFFVMETLKPNANGSRIYEVLSKIRSEPGLLTLVAVHGIIWSSLFVVDNTCSIILETEYGMSTMSAAVGLGFCGLGLAGVVLINLVTTSCPVSSMRTLFSLLLIPVALGSVFVSKFATDSTAFLMSCAANVFFTFPLMIFAESMFLQPFEHLAGVAGGLLNSMSLLLAHTIAAFGVPLVTSSVQKASSMLELYILCIWATAALLFWLGVSRYSSK